MEKPIEKVFSRLVAAMDDWEQEKTPEVLRKEIFAELDKAKKEIVLKLLGFNKSYGGKWELDHCNGRAGESAAGQYLTTQVDVILKDWLKQITLPKMTDTFRKRIETQLQARYEERIVSRIYEAANKAADQTLAELTAAVVQSDIIDKYKQTHQLLNPEENQ